VLEFGREVAPEIVLDDEDAEEVGVAAGAEDVPGEGGEAKRRESGGMKEAEGVAPALGDERPEKNGATGEDDTAGPFARTARPRKDPKRTRASQGVCGMTGEFSLRVRPARRRRRPWQS